MKNPYLSYPKIDALFPKFLNFLGNLQKKLNKNIDYVQVDQKDRDKYTERFNEILQEAEQFPSQVVANGKPVAGRRNTSFQEDYPLHQGTGLSINDVPSNTGLTDANGTTIN